MAQLIKLATKNHSEFFIDHKGYLYKLGNIGIIVNYENFWAICDSLSPDIISGLQLFHWQDNYFLRNNFKDDFQNQLLIRSIVVFKEFLLTRLGDIVPINGEIPNDFVLFLRK